VPLRHQGNLVGVWVLLFFTPPAFDEAGLSVLEQFGQYAAGLIAFQAKWSSRENQLVQAEQQARLSGAAQMFQHVLKNELFTLGSQTSTLLRTDHISDVHATARLLSESLGKLEDRAQHLSDFMRAPQPQMANVLTVWNSACRDISLRATRLGVVLEAKISGAPESLNAWFDPLIVQQIIFVILQNALDAIESAKAGGCIRLTNERGSDECSLRFHVSNDGPPIPVDVRERLFQKSGVSTKPRGQGVALYFAATRMRDMFGVLCLAAAQPPQGCIFEFELPRNA
jgi:signal transduction histidine kinase